MLVSSSVALGGARELEEKLWTLLVDDRLRAIASELRLLTAGGVLER